MRELVIGATGRIGGFLARLLPECKTTSRRRGIGHDHVLDLCSVGAVPACDIAYICGGANGAKACEGSQEAFLANVDGPIEVARQVAAQGGFTVYISSMSVEWQGAGAYQRQKLAAESILRAMPGVGIVRAGRVVPENVRDLCETLIRVGRGRITGVTRWGTDDIAYAVNGARAAA